VSFDGVAMSAGILVQARLSESHSASAQPANPVLPVLAVAARHRHRLLPLENKPEGSLLIHEIYRSLQGESTFAGLPCVFIRLTACHLRCVYCDTPHAFAEGHIADVDAVLAKALELGDDLVEITGGEPLLQQEVYPLMTRLADAGRTVLLETSGAVDTRPVDPRVRVILDIKTPGSGEVDANVWTNIDRLKPTDELKIVVCNRADFDWAAAIVRSQGLARRCPVLFSASFGQVDATELAAWILESRLPVRLQLQQHKILWNPSARGV
jgi:7-carboxy-7-deazaguanine synthase